MGGEAIAAIIFLSFCMAVFVYLMVDTSKNQKNRAGWAKDGDSIRGGTPHPSNKDGSDLGVGRLLMGGDAKPTPIMISTWEESVILGELMLRIHREMYNQPNPPFYSAGEFWERVVKAWASRR